MTGGSNYYQAAKQNHGKLFSTVFQKEGKTLLNVEYMEKNINTMFDFQSRKNSRVDHFTCKSKRYCTSSLD